MIVDRSINRPVTEQEFRKSGKPAAGRGARVALALLLMLGSSGLSSAWAAETAKPGDVRVVNTPTEPVPVAVQGTPPVAITNMPTVHLDSNEVAVTNPVALAGPVEVRPAAPVEVFYRHVSLRFGPSSANNCLDCDIEPVLDVPDGKIAVIEHVSVWVGASTQAAPAIELGTSGGTHFTQFEYVDTDSFGFRHYVGSHQLKLVVPSTPGAAFGSEEVRAFLLAGSFTTTPEPPSALVELHVTGYLVDGSTQVNDANSRN